MKHYLLFALLSTFALGASLQAYAGSGEMPEVTGEQVGQEPQPGLKKLFMDCSVWSYENSANYQANAEKTLKNLSDQAAPSQIIELTQSIIGPHKTDPWEIQRTIEILAKVAEAEARENIASCVLTLDVPGTEPAAYHSLLPALVRIPTAAERCDVVKWTKALVQRGTDQGAIGYGKMVAAFAATPKAQRQEIAELVQENFLIQSPTLSTASRAALVQLLRNIPAEDRKNIVQGALSLAASGFDGDSYAAVMGEFKKVAPAFHDELMARTLQIYKGAPLNNKAKVVIFKALVEVRPQEWASFSELAEKVATTSHDFETHGGEGLALAISTLAAMDALDRAAAVSRYNELFNDGLMMRPTNMGMAMSMAGSLLTRSGLRDGFSAWLASHCD